MYMARGTLVLPILGCLACGSSDNPLRPGDGAGPGVLTSCDPFAPEALPIALGTVIAVGQDSSGVIYAVDQVDTGQRVFLSDGSGTLVRQRLAGSGQGPDFYVFNITDANPAFVLQIDIAAGGSVRMGVVMGTLKDSKTFVIGQQGEELTVLPAASVAGMPLRNLPGEVVLEYAASLANGDVMVVTRPRDDWSYPDFRLFLGPLGSVAERRVNNVTRYTDGGSTTIAFDLDGSPATASFPVLFADGGFVPGPATLTVAGTTTALTRQAAQPIGATYLCFDGQTTDAGGGVPPVDAPSADAGVPPVDAQSADAGGNGLPIDAQSQDASACSQTSCLGGQRYLYQSNRFWNPASGSTVMPKDTLTEADYHPATDGGSYLLSFSPDGETVVVARVDGTALQDAAGAVTSRTDATVVYDLKNNWAGAQLIVSFGTELGAELTIFGSGLPIVESTRGTMSLTTSYVPVGETCALPLALPYDGYMPATYSDALANAGASPVTCAGIRDGYCAAQCAGWLVANIAWRDTPAAAAYDPITQVLVGWKTGEEAYGVCHGTFPPLASDGTPGWDPVKMDRTTGCK